MDVKKLLLWIALGAPAVFAQADWQKAAGGKMAFEVASVKKSSGSFVPPAFPLDEGDAFRPTGGLFHADFPLTVYIQFAYKYRPTQEQTQALLAHLPKWVATDRFTIQARAEGSPTKDQFRLMMQSLLADRFKLELHFETREAPIFGLTLIKPGKLEAKLRRHAEGPPCDAAAEPASAELFPQVCDVYAMTMGPSGARLGSRNTTMDLMASSLAGPGRLGRPVVNQTGLSGKFDFVIAWTPEPDIRRPVDKDTIPDTPGTTFLEALREQLGLKLEATRGPIKILVVDHVESPSEN
jgi:bla regulator protein BlaR1